jgi:hypothetical protein
VEDRQKMSTVLAGLPPRQVPVPLGLASARSKSFTDALAMLHQKAADFSKSCEETYENDLAWLYSELRAVKTRFVP